MSDIENSNNPYVIGTAVTVIVAILVFFTLSGYKNVNTDAVRVNSTDVAEKTAAVPDTKDKTPEQVAPETDRTHKAIDRNPVDESVKKTEDIELSDKD
jgi:hypothetical protein